MHFWVMKEFRTQRLKNDSSFTNIPESIKLLLWAVTSPHKALSVTSPQEYYLRGRLDADLLFCWPWKRITYFLRSVPVLTVSLS